MRRISAAMALGEAPPYDRPMGAVAIIPARGGSKGLPGKNLADFRGRPLVAWTIEAALEAGLDRVFVSTDDPAIAGAARNFGAEVIDRPAELAGDESPMSEVVDHALGQIAGDTIVLLQPTSPLRSAADIRESLELHRSSGRPVVSVTAAKPWLFEMAAGGELSPMIERTERRQDIRSVAPNGAIYIASRDALGAGGDWWDDPVGYEMPAERSVDIDTQAELDLALFYASRG